MSTAKLVLSFAVFIMLIWTISATQATLEDGVQEGRKSKVKTKDLKKAFKEAAALLQVVKNLGQLVTLKVSPILQLKTVAISSFTALITFFWFVYELLKAKEPTKVTMLLPAGLKSRPKEEPSQASVAILPVVSNHEVHTYDYDDYADVYNYKQHFGNKRNNYHFGR